ncbi:vesicle transport protein GOT1A isoform X1 [Balearica regulorum gibbericeps]|uniref:vesicle transport protein GOT1A isoform X1 n=1 Tax=Balearica regulorum gibbericeps TaxID=100784 RepID=UPI003F639418
MVSLTDFQRIGVGLVGFGLFFILFGMLLYFDSVLLAFGNEFFPSGFWVFGLAGKHPPAEQALAEGGRQQLHGVTRETGHIAGDGTARASPGSGSPAVSCHLSQPWDPRCRLEPPPLRGRCLAAPRGSREQLLNKAPTLCQAGFWNYQRYFILFVFLC